MVGGQRPAALASDIHRTAAAPSEICDEVPAVWMPSGSTGLRAASPSSVVSRRPWSRSTTWTSPVAPSGPTHRRLDGEHLALEATLGPRLGRLALRRKPQGVGVGSADRVLLGDALGCPELVGYLQRKAGRERPARTVDDVDPEAHPTHGLDAASDGDIHGAGGDGIGGEVIGLLGRAALAVDGGGGDLVGQTLVEPGRASDVEGLLPGLGDTTSEDLLDL